MSTAPGAASILVVDDDLQLAELLRELLVGAGYRVRSGVAEQALAAAHAAPPGLILLDVQMPGMDGIEFWRRLRDDPRTRAVPVVFVTGMDPAALAVRLEGRAPASIIAKPYTLALLLAAVRRHLAA